MNTMNEYEKAVQRLVQRLPIISQKPLRIDWWSINENADLEDKRLLEKNPAAFDLLEYCRVLDSGYDSILYYLPYVIEYIKKEPIESDVFYGSLWIRVGSYKKKFKDDGIWDDISSLMGYIFYEIIREFKVHKSLKPLESREVSDEVYNDVRDHFLEEGLFFCKEHNVVIPNKIIEKWIESVDDEVRSAHLIDMWLAKQVELWRETHCSLYEVICNRSLITREILEKHLAKSIGLISDRCSQQYVDWLYSSIDKHS